MEEEGDVRKRRVMQGTDVRCKEQVYDVRNRSTMNGSVSRCKEEEGNSKNRRTMRDVRKKRTISSPVIKAKLVLSCTNKIAK